ncbi:MAG: TonB-dependent receptor plug domain-containing protein [Myxococcaceae bacterium]
MPPEAGPDEAGLEGLLSEPVVSSASRTAESASDAPATTWSISGTDLQRYGIQSVEEAIRFLGHGMTSYEYDQRLNAAFGARGYLSDNLGLHLAVLIDGNQAGGSAKTARGTQQYLLPIELVDHIELVLGPGSVVYGNSAMLGVVNIVTRSGASVEGTHLVAQGSGGTAADRWARDSSWGEVWGRAAAYGAHKTSLSGEPFELAWHLAARGDRQEGRAMWRPKSGADAFADPLGSYTREDVFNRDFHARAFARATWGNWAFLSTVGYSQSSGTGPIEGSGASSSMEPEYMLDAKWSKHVSDRGDLSLRMYAVVFDSRAVLMPVAPDEARCLEAVGVPACADTVHYINFRPFFEPIFSWDWSQDGSQVTTLGAQAFVDGSLITTGVASIDNSKVRPDDPIIAPLPNAAAYVQHIWRGSVGSLNAGLRGDVGLLGWALSPRVALSRSFWQNGTLKLIVSTGFRTPTITERFLEIEGFVIPNPDIRAERVYSAEIDLSQRLGLQNAQLAVFGTYWDGLITTRRTEVDGGGMVNQFVNLRNVVGAGVNLGWQGGAGPLDWALSLNYAPGRILLPADVARQTDQQLGDLRLAREAVDRFGAKAFGSVFLPAEGMPDFYAVGHLSIDLGANLPRLSLAANLNSPRLRFGYPWDGALVDPRNVEGPMLPWSVDVRGAVEQRLSESLGVRLVMTARSLATVASSPRVGDGNGPAPSGGMGTASNPVAPVSAMLEANVRL